MKQQYERRIQSTKEKIYNAFLQLAKNQPINQISISELCSMARINRSTFYHHFGSQYDVLRDLRENFLFTLEQRLHNASHQDKDGLQKRVELCFRYAQENTPLTLLLMKYNVESDFADRLLSLPKIEDLLNEKFSDLEDEWERQAAIAFISHGSFHLIQEWLTSPNGVSPEQEAALVLKLARKVC